MNKVEGMGFVSLADSHGHLFIIFSVILFSAEMGHWFVNQI